MKYAFLPKLYGIVKDYHKRMIPEGRLGDGLNVLFEAGKIKTRWGYLNLGNGPLSGPITAISYFELVSTLEKYLLVFTTRDSYFYNPATGKFQFITKNFSAGTVSCSGSDVTLSGDTASWAYTTWPSGVCKIKFGTSNMNGVSAVDDSWYSVSAFTGPHGLTLAGNGPACTSVPYVIRLCWSGDVTDYHSVALPWDDSLGEKIVVVSNGVDRMQKWTGKGAMVDLAGMTRPARFIHYFGSIGYEHLIAAWTRDGMFNLPYTIEVSDAGQTEVWNGTYYELLNTNDEIKGILPLENRLIIYKEHSITEAWPNPQGGNIDPFDFVQDKIRDIGTPSIRTVVNYGSFHIFLGDNIYVFDGTTATPIGAEIINTLMAEINMNSIGSSFALPLRKEHLYCLFVPTNGSHYPNKVYAFNYYEKTWTIWQLAHEMTSGGQYTQVYAPTWRDIFANGTGPKWNDMKQRWRDLILYDNNLTYVLGDKDGRVYQFGPDFLTDNGTPIKVYASTGDFPLNDIKHNFRLCECTVGLGRKTGTQLRVRASLDFGETWTSWTPCVPDRGGEYREATAQFIERGRQVRFEFDTDTNSVCSIEIESVSIGYNDMGVGG